MYKPLERIIFLLLGGLIAVSYACTSNGGTSAPNGNEDAEVDTDRAEDSGDDDVRDVSNDGSSAPLGTSGERDSYLEDTSTDSDSSEVGDSGVPCGPATKKNEEYYTVEGDVEERPPCNEVCEQACLVCDGEYPHPIKPGAAYAANYSGGTNQVGGDCSKRPDRTTTNLNGEEEELEGYECYCRQEE